MRERREYVRARIARGFVVNPAILARRNTSEIPVPVTVYLSMQYIFICVQIRYYYNGVILQIGGCAGLLLEFIIFLMAVMHVECACVWAMVRELIFSLSKYGYVVQAKHCCGKL